MQHLWNCPIYICMYPFNSFLIKTFLFFFIVTESYSKVKVNNLLPFFQDTGQVFVCWKKKIVLYKSHWKYLVKLVKPIHTCRLIILFQYFLFKIMAILKVIYMRRHETLKCKLDMLEIDVATGSVDPIVQCMKDCFINYLLF